MRTYTADTQVKSADLNLLIINQRQRFPMPIVAANWAVASWDGATPINSPCLLSSGAGAAFVDLQVPQGYKLASLTVLAKGNAASNLTVGIEKAPSVDAVNVSLASVVANAVPAAPADITVNMIAASTTNAGGQTVTVTSDGGTPAHGIYTRSAGSFIADGFFVGQTVAWSGFVNAGNNATTVITALTATVMTTSNLGFVAETCAANAGQANGASPLVDGTFSLQLKLTASAGSLSVKGLRYTCIPAQ